MKVEEREIQKRHCVCNRERESFGETVMPSQIPSHVSFGIMSCFGSDSGMTLERLGLVGRQIDVLWTTHCSTLPNSPQQVPYI